MECSELYLHWALPRKGRELAAGPLSAQGAGQAAQQELGQGGQKVPAGWPGWQVGDSECRS